MAYLADTFMPLHAERKKQQWKLDSGAPDHDSLILVAVSRAMYWTTLLESGAYARVSDLAEAEGLKPTTVGRILRLARLAPDLVEDLLQGRQPARLTLYWLMRHDIPSLWSEQREVMEQLK